MCADVPRDERALRNHPKSASSDVVEREPREGTGQAPMLEHGQDLRVAHDAYAGPVPVRRKPGERVVDKDLVPGGVGVIHHPHRFVGHAASLANLRPGPGTLQNISSNYLFFMVG